MPLQYTSNWMDDDLTAFRDTVARFVETEMLPHDARWRAQHHVDRGNVAATGQTGLLCLDVPEQYGGGGGDFRHEAVMYEECGRRGLSGFGQGVHSICAHYVLNHGTEAQKHRVAAAPCIWRAHRRYRYDGARGGVRLAWSPYARDS